MIKGFIFYQHGKIPFVINRYIMELFTDDSLLSVSLMSIISKRIILFMDSVFLGFQPQKITILVEHSIGVTVIYPVILSIVLPRKTVMTP